MTLRTRLFSLCALAGAVVAPLAATPLDPTAVPSTSAWQIHLDVERWLATQTGAAVVAQLRAKDFSGDGAWLKSLPLEPWQLLQGVRGVTLYGLDLAFEHEAGPEAVALVRLTPTMMQVVEGAIAAMELEKPQGFAVTELGETRIFSIEGQGVATIVDGETLALARTPLLLTTHLAAQQTPQPATEADALRREALLATGDGFLMLSLAKSGDATALPPQARMLQMTEGGVLWLGESENSLDVSVTLLTDSMETAQQVRQVLQGLVAVASLTQSGDPDVSEWIRTARVDLRDRAVRLTTQFPVERALAWIAHWANVATAEASNGAQNQ